MSTDTIEEEIKNLKRQMSQAHQRITTLQQLKIKRQRCNNRIDQALCLLKHEYLPLDKLILHQFPDLVNKRDFWQALLHMKTELPPLPEAYFLITHQQPQSILQDKHLMLQLCSYDSWFYRTIPKGNPLKNDADILETVLLSNPCYISRIPTKILALDKHASLIGATLARLPLSTTYLSNTIRDSFPPIVWQHRQVALGWAKGGGIFHSHIPEVFLNDKAILFQFQENKKIVSSTLNIPAQLRTDKPSMIALLKSNPTNMEQIANKLIGDYALPIAALSTTKGIAFDSIEPPILRKWLQDDFIPGAHSHNQHLFLYRIAQTIRKRLQSHNIFIKLILGTIHNTTRTSSKLTILNQGNTTSCEAYTKPIAHFLGIPMGKELHDLHAARQTLTLLGVHWSDSLHDTTMMEELVKLRTTCKSLTHLSSH